MKRHTHIWSFSALLAAWSVTAPAMTKGDSMQPVESDPHLVAHYTFDHPVPDDATWETDRGRSGTGIVLVNGGGAMRVTGDPAWPGAGAALQTRPVDGQNNDWKAGRFEAGGVAGLAAFSGVRGMTLAGWFQQTGPNPSPGHGAIGLVGVLSGTSEGHRVRALLEVFEVDGEPRLVALGRRLDGGESRLHASTRSWHALAPRGRWVHLAASFDFDGGEMRLYADGAPLDGYDTAAGDPWALAADPRPRTTSTTLPTGIKIGGSFPQNTREVNPCHCRMDDLMFFDRALTPGEMARLFETFRPGHPVRLPVSP